LSGGERSRLVLARIAAREPNLLLLDEPTNHLDIPAQEALQEVLAEFPGTLILVSHDRYLVQALATHLWIMSDGGLTQLPGQWEDYLRWRQAHAATASVPDKAKTRREEERQEDRRAEQKKRRETEKLTKRQEQLEAEITQREHALKELGEAITRAGETRQTDEVRRLGEEYGVGETALQKLWDEWAQIGEQLETACETK
jgi:ATP-binding cassette subfamily F protein 3